MLSNFKRGLCSGFLATAPMSLFTFSLFRKLPPNRKKELVLAVHFGYGILTALVYTAIAKRFKFKTPLAQGVGFGLATWAASYGGLTPLYNLRETTEDMIERKRGAMTAAHVVWGVLLAFVEHNLRNVAEE